MNDSAQIRRRIGAPRANDPLLRPSPNGLSEAKLQKPATPRLKISNREPLRSEIGVTQTKERTETNSNREKVRCFSIRFQSLSCTHHKISNREPLRLEIGVTHTKERRVRADDSARRNEDLHSNREKVACFSIRFQSLSCTHHKNSNRESKRLEIDVTQTKERAFSEGVTVSAGGPAFGFVFFALSEGVEVGGPSFPTLVYGKGGGLRPRRRLCFCFCRCAFLL